MKKPTPDSTPSNRSPRSLLFKNARPRLIVLFALLAVAASLAGSTALTATRDPQEVKARESRAGKTTDETQGAQTTAAPDAQTSGSDGSRLLTKRELAQAGVPDLPECEGMVTVNMIARVRAVAEDPHETFERWREEHRSMMEESPLVECQSKLWRAVNHVDAPGASAAMPVDPAEYVARRLTPEGTLAALSVSLGANVDPASGVENYQGEMQVMVNPNNPQQLVAGANSFYRDPSANCQSPTGTSTKTFGTQALYGSSDGGATWTYRCAPWPAAITGQVTGAAAFFGSDPAMAWDAQGNAYAVYMLISQNSTGSTSAASIVIAKSTDVGQNWTPLGTVVDNIGNPANFDDKEMVAIDTSAGPASTLSHPGRIYVIWDENNVERIAYSDNGSAWTIVVLPATGFGNFDIGGNVVVGRDGTVYVIWNRLIFPSSQTGEKTVFSKSVDGGATWSTPVVVATESLLSFGSNNKPAAQESRGLNAFGSLAIDNNPSSANFGRLYVAYPDFPAGTTAGTNVNVYLVRSSDGGATWSAPVKANDDVGAATQFFPWASVDQSDGSVNVSWYDTRVDPTNNRKSQLFYARSSNGGVSFEPNVLIDDSGGTVWRNLVNFSDENTSDNPSRNANQYGDYSGIIAANRQVHPFWMDSRQFFPSADTVSPTRREDAASALVTTCSAPVAVAAPTVSSTCGVPGTLVSWSAPSGWGTNATSGTYSVYRSTTNSFPGGSPLASGLTTTSYVDTTGALGTTYYYFVRATNDCPGTPLTPMTSDSAGASIVFSVTGGACGALRGTVSSAGTPVGGAVVTANATSVSTDPTGFYQLVGIPPGTYTVSAAASGYVTGNASGVVVASGGDTTQNFDLAPDTSPNCPTDTTQTDFGALVDTTLDLTSSPGDVKLAPNVEQIDQLNTAGTTTGTGFGTPAWTGQTFVPTITAQLVKADVQLFCNGCGATPPNLTLSVRNTSGGLPTGADLATATIPGSAFASGASVLFTASFGSPATLTAGTQYALILRPVSAPAGNGYFWIRSSPSTYANGSRVLSADSGSTWTADTTRDYNFKTYMQQAGFQSSGSIAPLAKDSNPPAGSTTDWTTLSWTATTPANTSVKFQVAASNSAAGPFNFVGPDGTAATFFTTPGASLSQFDGNRYLQYKAFLATSDTAVTLTLSDVTVCYNHVALAAPFTISGQITNSNGDRVGGVTVSLSGSLAATTATDDDGNYSLSVPAGASVTVTPSRAGYTFAPPSATFNSLAANQTASFVGTPASPASVAAGSIIISEFRLRGAQGAQDEFVELYNNTDQPITVGTNDGSAGWALSALDAGGATASTVLAVPVGTTIPARGHYLVINSTALTGYSLGSAAVGDGTFTADLPDDTGLALFATSNPVNLAAASPLDAVGFQSAGALANTYREGTGLASVGATDGEYSFARKLLSGQPQDTGNNSADFVFVSTDGGVYGGVGSRLGAPGPENLSSPINRGAVVKAGLVAPCVASSASPNRERDTTADTPDAATSHLGTLTIRRRFTNTTSANVTRLRFRIVDVTTRFGGASPSTGTADLRAITSGNVTIQPVTGNPCGTQLNVKGLTLEQPPNQTTGGGFNSTLSADTVSVSQLAPGASIDVQFRLGVMQGGAFRFFVIVEGLTDAPVSQAEPADPAKGGAPKLGGGRQGSAKSGSRPLKFD